MTMVITTEELTLAALRTAYQAQTLTPSKLCEELLSRIAGSRGVFITPASSTKVFERCRFLESIPAEERGGLWGIPFAVKDNIDVAGFPTTCACPAFAYVPDRSAASVQALLDAGGICLGKTNLDQFACGLVGTRSPYGIPPNAFDDRFVPGGSSCGSAVAVSAAMVSFALGTDTAGSGRVPAGLNGIVGIKPSLGRFSNTGLVPACYLLDCISIMALSVQDGTEVARIMENSNISDPTYRERVSENLIKRYVPTQRFKFAVPSSEFLDFSGPGGETVRKVMEARMKEAVTRLVALGGEQFAIDFCPFGETAVLLYGGAFVAERYSGIRAFLEKAIPEPKSPDYASLVHDQRLLRVTRSIIAKASRWSAPDVFNDLRNLSVLRAAARVELAKIDVLVVPTAEYNYTIREIVDEEEGADIQPVKNTNLGRWTNFVNLMDMCGISVPSGLIHCEDSGSISTPATEAPSSMALRNKHLMETGNPNPVLPFGITLLAPAWTDEYVAGVAAAYEKASGLKAGPLGHGVTPYRTTN